MDFIEEFETAISLWGDDNIVESIASANVEDLFEFAETLSLISKYHFSQSQKPNEKFSFVANSSLSGGGYPCSNFECRESKISQLITFTSLYADEVYIQNPFENIILKEPTNLVEADREELIHGIINYYHLKPLIENGLIKYANNIVSLCEHHSETIAKPLAEKIEKKENKLYEIIHDYLIDRCSITYDVSDTLGPFLEISGPEGFIDHGVIYFYLYSPIPDYIESIKNKKLPYKISKEQITDEGILSLIISPLLNDLSRQEWHNNFYGTSYLCDNSNQIKIASKINNKASVANSEAFENGMNHYLPAIYSKDINTIMTLRNQESESFAVYRDKLYKIMHEAKNWNNEEVAELFRDQILPEINVIDKKVKDWKYKTRQSLKDKVLFGTGAVSIGLYAGLLPTGIGQILAAVGGGAAVTSAFN